ncbi:hypothetical protein ACHAXS_013256 [Conticribra weissflogii]
MADSEPVLRSLGISLRSPFHWGDEPQIQPVKKSRKTALVPSNTSASGSKTSTTTLSFSSAEALTLAAPSGLDSIKKFVQEERRDESIKGANDAKVKQVLRSLLRDADVALPPKENNDDDDDGAKALELLIAKRRKRHEKLLLLHGTIDDELRDVPIRGLSDRAVAQLTVESKASLFGSILRIFDMDRAAVDPCAENTPGARDNHRADESSSDDDDDDQIEHRNEQSAQDIIMKRPILTTPEIVRTVHLAARPGDIPPGMDSKEYTLAALHFLSTPIPTLSEEDFHSPPPRDESREGWEFLRRHLPIMPLLRAVDPREPIEKRSYGRVRPLISAGSHARKEVPDSVDLDLEFRKKVLNLERIFSSSLPYSATHHLSAKVRTGSGDTINTTTPTIDSNDDTNDVRFAFQNYVPRRKLCPHIDGGVKEELTVMISGHFQQQYQPGLASSKASNASLATTSTSGGAVAAASSKASSPPKPKPTSSGGKTSAKKPTPHLKIKLGMGSKAKTEKKEGSGSGVTVKSPSHDLEEEWSERGGFAEVKEGSEKKRVLSDREEFGF